MTDTVSSRSGNNLCVAGCDLYSERLAILGALMERSRSRRVPEARSGYRLERLPFGRRADRKRHDAGGDIMYFDLNEPLEANRGKAAAQRSLPLRPLLQDVVGVLRAKTLLDAAFERKARISPPRSLSRCTCRHPTMTELLGAFEHRQHLALVIDEYGELQGMMARTKLHITWIIFFLALYLRGWKR